MTAATIRRPSRLGATAAPAARWTRPALAALLAATALLYLIGLSRSGWANDFYAAAVQAGTKSWKAFFFGSFDAANFITVDKTPASLWVMELSARLFGLSSWSVLVPQALEGVASAALLYAAARRWFGPGAGLLAGLTPAADQPYVGGSTNDSILQLALGYNGLGRLDGSETGSVGFSHGNSTGSAVGLLAGPWCTERWLATRAAARGPARGSGHGRVTVAGLAAAGAIVAGLAGPVAYSLDTPRSAT